MNRRLMMLPLVLGLASPLAVSAAGETTEQRIQRLERLLDSGVLVEMQQRLETLQMENQQLRGELESQAHELNGLKQRQRELYLDADRRLSRVEREGGGMAPAEVPLAAPENAPVAAAVAPAVTPVTTPTETVSPTAAAPDEAQLAAERAAYEKAFNLLRELRYEQAITAFRAFLKQYPDGRYAHIAQYWLGEASYTRRDFKQAISDYRALIKGHPSSPKLAEAMLKIGYCHRELGDDAAARAQLEQLVKRYPNSTEAGQARSLLKRLPAAAG